MFPVQKLVINRFPAPVFCYGFGELCRADLLAVPGSMLAFEPCSLFEDVPSLLALLTLRLECQETGEP